MPRGRRRAAEHAARAALAACHPASHAERHRSRPRPDRRTDLHRRSPPGPGRRPSPSGAGASSPWAATGTSGRWSVRGRACIELRGRTVTPGFGDAHVHPPHGRPRPDPLRAPRPAGAGPVPGNRRRVRRGQPGRRVDPRRRLVARRLPGRPPPARGPRPRLPRPPGVPAQPRRPRRMGQQRGARLGPGSRSDTPDPDDGRIARDADGTPQRHAPRGGDGPGGAARPAGHCGRPATGDPREPALPPLAGHHELAGRVGDAARRRRPIGSSASRAS